MQALGAVIIDIVFISVFGTGRDRVAMGHRGRGLR
jgi:hypothetical protein